jgi:hypothetical protein
MTYTKPEVAVLGKAAVVIENSIPKNDSARDGGGQQATTPAYDLDE